MLPYVFLGIAVLFFALGAIDQYSGNKTKWLSFLFFSVAFFHLLAALYLFSATDIAAYGSLKNQTIIYNYTHENLTVNSYDDVGIYQGFENRTVAMLTAQTTDYVYYTQGNDIANLFVYIDGFVFFLLFFLILVAQIVKWAKVSLGHKEEEEHELY